MISFFSILFLIQINFFLVHCAYDSPIIPVLGHLVYRYIIELFLIFCFIILLKIK